MNKNEIEDLCIKSFDQTLNDSEKKILALAIESDSELASSLIAYKNVRELLLRKEPATFGPYFAQKVITRIHNMREELDQQIAFFFKKFRVVALSVMIALLTFNIIFSDQLDIASVIGIEEAATTDTDMPEDEIEHFDFLETFVNN